jgi:hypothetical protein
LTVDLNDEQQNQQKYFDKKAFCYLLIYFCFLSSS